MNKDKAHLKELHGIEYLLDLNARHSAVFASEAACGDRRMYRKKHPLEISVIKCMDGRLNVPVMTNTAMGIIQPWRNVGGRFNLGWVGFKDAVANWYEYSLSQSRSCLVMVSYHYSRGDKHRGCAGFNYDTDAARASALELQRQFIRVFGNGTAFYTILVGIETDLDALVLHGDDAAAESLDLATISDGSTDHLESILRKLYPQMPSQILEDFIPIVAGNLDHIKEIRATNRPVADILHGESVLALGRGFDWLHEPNKAIIVGPFDPELRIPISIGAKLLLSNLNEGRIPKEHGVVLMTSAPYRERAGYDRPAAREKALWLNQFALRIIKEEATELLPYLHQLTAIMDSETRELDVLHRV